MDRRDYILRLIEQADRAPIALRERILGREATIEEVREAPQRARVPYGLVRPLAGNLVDVCETAVRIEEIEARLEPSPDPAPRTVRHTRTRRRAATPA